MRGDGTTGLHKTRRISAGLCCYPPMNLWYSMKAPNTRSQIRAPGHMGTRRPCGCLLQPPLWQTPLFFSFSGIG